MKTAEEWVRCFENQSASNSAPITDFIGLENIAAIQSDAIESCAVSIESEPATSSEQRRRDLYLAAKLRSLIPQKEKKV